MTEAEWRTTNDLTAMFGVLRARKAGSTRKRLLLGLACAERVLPFMSADARPAVAVAERFGRGEATEAERGAAFERAGEAYEEAMAADDRRAQPADYCAYRVVQVAGETELPADWGRDTLAHMATTAPGAFSWTGTGWDKEVFAAHTAIIVGWVRCVFGNPFRPAAVDPEWRTAAVVGLAEFVDAGRAWDRLPVLADALEDAGCTDPDLIGHLRGPGPHARGCWVVDGLLGRS